MIASDFITRSFIDSQTSLSLGVLSLSIIIFSDCGGSGIGNLPASTMGRALAR
jgi:hypothetical protein